MAISKVIYGDQTLIDITDTTATAFTVASGQYFYDKAGEKIQGVGSALGHETEILDNGGTAHHISGIDLGNDTVDSAHLYTGYTAHDSSGTLITGSMTGPPLKMGVIRSDAELVKTWSYDVSCVNDWKITIPSYNTAQQTIKASQALTDTYTTSTDYDYYILERMLAIPTYNISTKGKGRVEYHMGSCAYELVYFPASSISALITPSTKYTTATRTFYATGAWYRSVYWSSGSGITAYSTSTYSTAQAVVAPGFSNGVITANTPNCTVRGHATYFTNTYFNAITDIRYQWICELYRVPRTADLQGWSIQTQGQRIIDCVDSSSHKLT